MPVKKQMSAIANQQKAVDHSMHECPKCGKQSLLQMQTTFRCIWCDFYRDLDALADKKSSNSSVGDFLFFIIVGIFLVLIFARF